MLEVLVGIVATALVSLLGALAVTAHRSLSTLRVISSRLDTFERKLEHTQRMGEETRDIVMGIQGRLEGGS